ncbi:MAG: PIN domain-containing protein [Chloroflexi bacterium]|nr:PIN domain-containing protein [Chloroflexota bacterium]
MTDLQSGERVFIDANIFVYHFGGKSLECRAFLERCARREIEGYTSAFILAEVLHRLMVAEAIQQSLVTGKNAVKNLAEKPELVKQLHQYNVNVRHLLEMNLTIVSLTPEIIAASEAIRTSEGLLTNDSLVVGTMRELEIINLASADDGFVGVTGLQVYKPADI